MTTQTQRRNGYYWHAPTQRHLVSVTTLLQSVGNKEGLLKWGAKQGGLGVLAGLARVSDLQALQQKLTSPAAYEWAKAQGIDGLRATSNIATRFGTKCHKAVEQYFGQEPIDEGGWGDDYDSLKMATRTIREFHTSVGYNIVGIEQVVYNPEGGYAGRMDYTVEFRRECGNALLPFCVEAPETPIEGIYIADLKTGTLHPKTHAFQLAAYVKAADQTTGTTRSKINGGLVFSVEKADPSKIRVVHFSRQYLNQVYEEAVVPAAKIWRFFDAPKWFKQQEEQHLLKEAA